VAINTIINDIHKIDPITGQCLPIFPNGKQFPNLEPASILVKGSIVYLFGGRVPVGEGGQAKCTNDLWMYDIRNNYLEQIVTMNNETHCPPPPVH
jgi:hypothetical protein